ncbi:TonB-dependent receptor plug domain-containing protein [Reinekea thalattae]|uniref:TonB-dependent receptor n=1 Tax=Reinekea thalattae TaxID=2593301 RepID=A0A5C8Z400_9GAMM|nr:TonB-dependent receptor [Reinekea thalattae]TXR51918.1 TonB-dependent receptor [Reinekea thalattae]
MKKTLPLLIAASLFAELQAQDSTETLIVTGKSSATEQSFAGTVDIVTANDIAQSGATNLLEAIATLPGVSATRTGSGRSGIQIRGMETNHTLILVDGRRLSDTDTNIAFSDYQLSWVPVEAIERIEVIRGPVSNLYGSSALGGVINIITKKSSGTWSGSVTAESRISNSQGDGGDENALAINAYGPLSSFGELAVSAERRSSDAFEANFDDTGASSSVQGKEITNFSADLGIYLNESTTLTLTGIIGQEERSTYPNELYYDIDRHQAGVSLESYLAGFDITAQAYQAASENYLVSYDYSHDITENVATLDIVGSPFNAHQIASGIEFASEQYVKDYTAATSTDFSDEFSAASAFIQDAYSLNDELTFTVGSRFDYNQRFGSEISPKAYVNWQINDQFYIKGGYGQGFKAPSISEASSDYVFYGYGYTVIGNSDLEAETSQTFELSAAYNHAGLSSSITVFNNDVENLINTAVTTGTTYQYQNVKDARITGIETEASYEFFEGLSSSLNYTYLDHEDKATGNELTNRSNHQASASVNYRLPVIDVNSQLAATYSSKQYVDDDNTSERAASTVIDLTFNKQFGDHLSTRVGVYNLLDSLAASEDEDGNAYTETGRLFGFSLTANL